MKAAQEVIPGLGMRAVQGAIKGEEMIALILGPTVQRWIAGDVNFPFDSVTFFNRLTGKVHKFTLFYH